MRCPNKPEFAVGTKVKVKPQGYVLWWHRKSDIATVALAKKMKMGGKMMWIYKLADENGEVQFNWCSAHQIETIADE